MLVISLTHLTEHFHHSLFVLHILLSSMFFHLYFFFPALIFILSELFICFLLILQKSIRHFLHCLFSLGLLFYFPFLAWWIIFEGCMWYSNCFVMFKQIILYVPLSSPGLLLLASASEGTCAPSSGLCAEISSPSMNYIINVVTLHNNTNKIYHLCMSLQHCWGYCCLLYPTEKLEQMLVDDPECYLTL